MSVGMRNEKAKVSGMKRKAIQSPAWKFDHPSNHLIYLWTGYRGGSGFVCSSTWEDHVHSLAMRRSWRAGMIRSVGMFIDDQINDCQDVYLAFESNFQIVCLKAPSGSVESESRPPTSHQTVEPTALLIEPTALLPICSNRRASSSRCLWFSIYSVTSRQAVAAGASHTVAQLTPPPHKTASGEPSWAKNKSKLWSVICYGFWFLTTKIVSLLIPNHDCTYSAFNMFKFDGGVYTAKGTEAESGLYYATNVFGSCTVSLELW